jgi:hypothetical protein
MRFADGEPDPDCVARGQDQVDVVRHQAVGPDLHVPSPGLFGQEIAIDLLISILEEDRLTPVAPLGDVVRQVLR